MIPNWNSVPKEFNGGFARYTLMGKMIPNGMTLLGLLDVLMDHGDVMGLQLVMHDEERDKCTALLLCEV